jgi:mono/diheme cytochrome c family protein
MRKFILAMAIVASAAVFVGCGADKNDPGRAYMPDMYYSRAYEAYGYNNVGGEYDSLRRRGILYTGVPVYGTVARGEMLSYRLTPDSAGMTKAETTLRNPFDSAGVSPQLLKEGERLYLVNCGICHGTKLDGNGPLFNNGQGPYPAAPRTLIDDQAKTWTDGHYFHVISFGIRQMGSYASQLRPDQRWWVINYIRSVQAGPAGAKPDSTAAATPLNQVPGGNADSTNQTNR